VSLPERRYKPYTRADGVVVQPDPLSCPEGEWFDLVGFQRKQVACGNKDHGVHAAWRCDHCGKFLYDPPCDLDGTGLTPG
jgi:hypothetical protein